MLVSFNTGEKPLPLWTVILSQDGWLPTLVWENPCLLCWSYGGTQKAEQTILISMWKTGWPSPSFSMFLHFCITLPASWGGCNFSPWHTTQNNCDELLQVAPSISAVCYYWPPETSAGESLCFQPRALADVLVQQWSVLANLKYLWPQDVPKQSEKKVKKHCLFFKHRVWEYSLNFWFWVLIAFVFKPCSATFFSHCPVHSPSIPNTKAKDDCFSLWNLRISSFLDMRH